MALFILLEPSCDIHLALDGNLNELPLQVFKGDFDGTTKILTINKVSMSSSTNNLEFDFYPVGQNVIEIQSGILVAKVLGTAFVQIRLKDPQVNEPNHYHYITARIRIHKKIKGWWFGNKSLSVFKDPLHAHSQPSLYALFEDKDGKEVVGDITGHGYVNLVSKVPSIFDLSPKYRDRIQGKHVGEGMLEGNLSGEPPTSIPVKVVDFMDPLAPKLEHVDVDHAKPRAEKFNILFLAEGFFGKDDEQNDEPLFIKAVQEVCQRLMEAPRHSPFNLLRDDFNTWRAFAPSRERGITVSSEITNSGNLIEQNDLMEEWTPLKINRESHGILQAKDSFYGLRYGLRSGERISEGSTEVITEGHADFFKRINSSWEKIWFVTSHQISLDWRRYAPELLFDVDPKSQKLRINMLHSFILKHIEQRIDPKSELNGTDREVGILWHPNWIPQNHDPGLNDHGRQVSSIGLVCILVNDELGGKHGGGNVLGVEIGLETLVAVVLDGRKEKILLTEEDNANTNTKMLTRTLNIAFRRNIVTTITAHEFGHSFCNLGDEYEKINVSNKEHRRKQDKRDNLMSIETLKSNKLMNKIEGRPVLGVDPDKIKWNLHRIRQADTIMRKIEPLPGERIKLTLAKGRTKRWEKVKNRTPPVPVFVRKFKAASSRQQLPIEHEDLLELQIVEIPDDESNTIILGDGSLPSSLDEFSAGSVFYIPRRHVHDDSPRLLIESATFEHLRKTKRPLSSNFVWRKNSFGELKKDCEFANNLPDRPHRIPGLDPPCETFKVIGVYEGGGVVACGVYRPAGDCKMRNPGTSVKKTSLGPHSELRGDGSYCYVCKYLFVNKVNPSKLSELEKEYPFGI